MKTSIIKDIFYGNRGQNDTIEESKEYWKAMGKAAMLSEELTESFSQKQKELFEQLEFVEMDIESEAALTFFTEGFKIGLLIGIECLE